MIAFKHIQMDIGNLFLVRFAIMIGSRVQGCTFYVLCKGRSSIVYVPRFAQAMVSLNRDVMHLRSNETA